MPETKLFYRDYLTSLHNILRVLSINICIHLYSGELCIPGECTCSRLPMKLK
jgi:hypothetical protein